MRKSSTLKGEEYKILMERMHLTKNPLIDKNLIRVEKTITPRACSSYVLSGGNDGSGMTEEASKWIRNIKPANRMEEDFWTQKAPIKKYQNFF